MEQGDDGLCILCTFGSLRSLYQPVISLGEDINALRLAATTARHIVNTLGTVVNRRVLTKLPLPEHSPLRAEGAE